MAMGLSSVPMVPNALRRVMAASLESVVPARCLQECCQELSCEVAGRVRLQCLNIDYPREEIMSHEQYQSCIDACDACAAACDHCAQACLGEKDVAHLARCIGLDVDCAAFCRAASSAMARGSEFSQQICAVCAEACEACAAECETHDMDHCRDCAAACRSCAQECRNMGTYQAGRASASSAGARH